MDREPRNMSPEKRNALSKLMEQELALDKQSSAIQIMLSKLGTYHTETTNVGSSMYSSLHDKYIKEDTQKRDSSVLNGTAKYQKSREYATLVAKFNEQVAATTSYHPAQVHTAPPMQQKSHHVEFDRTQTRGELQNKRATVLEEDEESVVGADVIKASHAQLARIREHRASTLAQRLQQKQEALQIAEQMRLNALHEVRHKAAMEIAVQHHAHQHYFRAIKYMYNNVKIRSNYALAEFKWKVVSMMSVLQKFMRHVHVNASSDAPYVVVRTRAGWRKFYRRMVSVGRAHVRCLQSQLVAYHFRVARHCRGFIDELRKLVRHKSMTGPVMEAVCNIRACKRAFAVFRRKLIGQTAQHMAVQEKLMLSEQKRTRAALQRLAEFARREGRKRAIIAQDEQRQLLRAFIALANAADARVHQAECFQQAKHFQRETALHKHLMLWHAHTVRTRAQLDCETAAQLHRSDISAAFGSHWLRDQVRRCLHQWFDRVQLRRKRSAPLRHFKSRKVKAHILALFRAWRSRVAQAKKKQRANKAMIVSCRTRRAWLWFCREHSRHVLSLHKQRDATVRPRSRLRTKHMALGFSAFRAYVLQNRAKRAVVKAEKLRRLVARMTEFFSKLYLRHHAKRKSRAVVRHRMGKLFARCFSKWREFSSAGRRKRLLLVRRKRQVNQLFRGFDALSHFAEQRMQRRNAARGAMKLLWKGKHSLSLRQWSARAQFLSQCREMRTYGKNKHDRKTLRTGLRSWLLYTESRVTVAQKGVHSVRPSWARRLTFMHRWVDFVADCQEKRAHSMTFQRQRQAKQLRVAFATLGQPRERKVQCDAIIHNFRETVLVPMLQQRFFRQVLLQQEIREERRADRRQHHYDQRACRSALRIWRAYRKERKYRARSSRLGDRQRFVITALGALSHWRYMTTMHHALVESERRAARDYRRKYFAPAFKAWLRNTTSLAHQFDARYLRHGNVFKKKQFKLLFRAFRRNWQRRKHQRASVRAGKIAYYRKTCGAQWTLFREYVLARRHCKELKAMATKQRTRTLLRIAFGGFVAEYRDAEARGLGKGQRHFARRRLRAALSTFRARLVRWRLVKKGLAHRKKKLLALGRDFMRSTLQCRRSRVARTKLLKAFYHTSLSRRYLLKWLNKDARWNGTQVGSVVGARPRAVSFTSPGKNGASGKSFGQSPTKSPAKGSMKSPGPAKTSAVIPRRRRSVVNPVHAMQQHRCALSMQALAQYTAQSKEDKAVLRAATQAVHTLRRHVHMTLWKRWMRQVTAAKALVVQGSQHMDLYRCAQYLPLLVQHMRYRRHLYEAEHHHSHFQYSFAWRRWTKYAYTGLRRARAQAKALHRRREKDAQQYAAAPKGRTYTPQFIDDDFSERASTRGRGGSMDDTASVDFNRDLAIAATVAAIEVQDHRVSVQRTQWHKGEAMHLVHSCLHAIARWRRWCRVQHHHRRLLHMCDHRQSEKVFTQLRKHLVRRKQYRADVRCALKARRHWFLVQSFRMLALHRRLCMASRQLRINGAGKIFCSWKLKVQYRVHAKHLITDLEAIHRSRMLKVAFREWVTDTAVENAVVYGVGIDRKHKLHHAIDHLLYHRKLRRRQSALLLRARRYKTNSLLRKVYTNLLLEMEARYRSIEVMRKCARFHRNYHCRRVIYNLFYLRRNRIAKDYNLARKFRLVLAALRLNKAVVRYDKSQMRGANVVIVRKMFRSLRRRARANVSKTRKLRTLKDRNGNRVARAVVLVAWNRVNRLRHGLRQLREHVKHRRLRKKLFRGCSYAHMKHHVYRCFRMLLSNARKCNLKKRNSQALYALFLNMQLRRAVSRLDINVSSKWARGQEKRLMDVHFDKQSLRRGLAAVKFGVLAASAAGTGASLLDVEDSAGEEESKGEAVGIC